MALEISSSRTHLRSFTLIGTGALLFVLVGYLLIKLDKKKAKKKPSINNTSENTNDATLEQVNVSLSPSPQDSSPIEDKQDLTESLPALTDKQLLHIDLDLSEKLAITVEVKEIPADEPEMTVQNKTKKANQNKSNEQQSAKPSSTPTPAATTVEDQAVPSVEPIKQVEIILQQQVPEPAVVVAAVAAPAQAYSNENKNAVAPAKTDDEPKKQQPEPVKATIPPLTKSYASIIASGLKPSAASAVQLKPAAKPVASKAEVLPAKTPATSQAQPKSTMSKSTSFSTNTNSKKASEKTPAQATKGMSRSQSTMNTSAVKKPATISEAKSGIETPNGSTVSDPYEEIVVYEFNFPRRLCGKLIGKSGVHVDTIRTKTHTQIAVRNDPLVEDLQIVCVSGRLEDVDQALETISNRFPAKHYPNISFKPISKPIVYRRCNNADAIGQNLLERNSKVLVAPNMFVNLQQYMPNTVAANNEDGKPSEMYYGHLSEDSKLADVALPVHVTSVVNAAHVFIQLPSNPFFESLPKLDQAMIDAYNNENSASPEDAVIPCEPIEYGYICAAPTSYGWHRAMVTSYMPKEEVVQQISEYNETCGLATIKFLDYGGYLTIPTNQLRQLRLVKKRNMNSYK
jgi:hypothetical protein